MRKTPTLVLLLAALACADPAGIHPEPGTSAELPGVIRHHGESTLVERPARVLAGEPFVVRVRTFGSGCVAHAGTSVDISGLRAEITPLDLVYVPRSDEACTTELRRIEHTVELRFDQPGTATVRVRGRGEPGGEPLAVVVWIPVAAPAS